MNKTIVREITETDGHVDYSVQESENLTLVLVVWGNNTTVNAKISLDGAGAQADILGFVVGKGNSRVNLRTVQEHKAPGTTSNLLVKSVLSDSAKFFYDGGIRVDRSAQKTDAYQRNENLLLSKNASAQSSPTLEILANDVRCTHGATIGSVSDDQLWYLRSRGIPKEEATQLIVSGFLTGALGRIADVEIRHEVEKKLWQIL